jgi:protein-ribulosamine 3-kinase
VTVRPPAALHRRVCDLLGTPDVGYVAVSGGCIAHAVRVDGPDGPLAFLKWSPAGDPAAATYPAEQAGLAALASSHAVKVPRVLGRLAEEGAAGLLLEWLPPAASSDEGWRRFGRSLARLHAARPGVRPGWPDDNALGPLPQSNAPAEGWGDFWWRRRLLPQIDLAASHLGALTERLHALAEHLPALLDEAFEADGASLLHGDLWSGNVHWTAGADGPRAALIDPSTYYGHREVDLAMAALFGGFPAPFWEGYEDERPLRPGPARRRPAYQLYYLLAHVNLFGASYLARTAEAVAALEAGPEG